MAVCDTQETAMQSTFFASLRRINIFFYFPHLFTRFFLYVKKSNLLFISFVLSCPVLVMIVAATTNTRETECECKGRKSHEWISFLYGEWSFGKILVENHRKLGSEKLQTTNEKRKKRKVKDHNKKISLYKNDKFFFRLACGITKGINEGVGDTSQDTTFFVHVLYIFFFARTRQQKRKF